MHARELRREAGAAERDREEKAQRNRRAVHARRLRSGCGLVNLIAEQVLAGCRIGRAAQELGKVLDVADIIMLRLLAELAVNGGQKPCRTWRHVWAQQTSTIVNGCQNPRKDGAAILVMCCSCSD
jgi:hypothetical protein